MIKVPRIFIPLKELPITSSGKVNISVLPLPHSPDFSLQVSNTLIAGASDTEIAVLKVVNELLPKLDIQWDEDLQLILDSFNITRLINKINDRFFAENGMRLGLINLPKPLTIRQLIKKVDELFLNSKKIQPPSKEEIEDATMKFLSI